MITVLGIHGEAGSGKDTIGDYLVESKGWGAKIAFAGNLKEMCQTIFGLTEYQINSSEGKGWPFHKPITVSFLLIERIIAWMEKTHTSVRSRYHLVNELIGNELKSPRDVLQLVGADICRVLVPGYHIDIVRKKVSELDKCVITDVRYPDEADFVVEELKGKVIKVTRTNKDDFHINRKHNSEVSMRGWDNFAAIIFNNSNNRQDLYREVDSIL